MSFGASWALRLLGVTVRHRVVEASWKFASAMGREACRATLAIDAGDQHAKS
jgi:hypothetical protein